MLVSVEKTDRFDSSTLAVDRPDEEFRSSEASRKVQQTKGQKGCAAWHAIVRIFNQKNMSGKNSAHAALISNNSARDKTKDVEQFDDILRTFINETNKFENRIGKIRDEEKMLEVKKLMHESLWNYRFRGTTMSYRTGRLTRVLRWRLEWRRKMMVKD